MGRRSGEFPKVSVLDVYRDHDNEMRRIIRTYARTKTGACRKCGGMVDDCDDGCEIAAALAVEPEKVTMVGDSVGRPVTGARGVPEWCTGAA